MLCWSLFCIRLFDTFAKFDWTSVTMLYWFSSRTARLSDLRAGVLSRANCCRFYALTIMVFDTQPSPMLSDGINRCGRSDDWNLHFLFYNRKLFWWTKSSLCSNDQHLNQHSEGFQSGEQFLTQTESNAFHKESVQSRMGSQIRNKLDLEEPKDSNFQLKRPENFLSY